MTKAEHHNAKALEDDGGIREIIQSARAMELTPEERMGLGQMAPLTTSKQLWGNIDTSVTSPRPRKKLFEDVTDHNAVGRVVEDDDEGIEHKRQRLTEQSEHCQRQVAFFGAITISE